MADSAVGELRDNDQPRKQMMTSSRAAAFTFVHGQLRRSAEESDIMGMPAAKPVTTIEQLLALPEDGQRHELLDGQHVVTPSPSSWHQRVLGRLYVALHASLADRADVEVLFSPADIHLGARTLVQPDLFVISRHPAWAAWVDAPVPLLAVEVLSPSTAARDRGTKRRIYLDAGVEEYWIIDVDARLIERWRVGDERPEIVEGTLDWSLTGGAAGSIDLHALFADID